jgi:hypothetical protein
MAIESVTRRELRSIIADTVADNIVEGTATAGTSTTLTDTSSLLFSNADALNGAWIYIYSGTSSGDERSISDYSSNVVTVASSWSSTPDTTSKYEVHRRFRVTDYNRAIDAAMRAARWQFLQPKTSISQLTNSNLLNPLMTNSTGGLADNWTNSGNAFSQVVYNPASITNEQVNITAVVFASSSNVIMRVNDGVTNTTVAHGGTGYEILRINNYSAAASAASVTVSIEVTGASSLTASLDSTRNIRGPYTQKLVSDTGVTLYVDSVYVPDPSSSVEYTIPSGFNSIHKVSLDTAGTNDDRPEMHRLFSEVDSYLYQIRAGYESPTNIIQFRHILPDDRAITIQGMGVPDMLTSDTDTVDVNVEPIRLYAAYYLNSNSDAQRAAFFRNEYERIRSMTNVHYPANSRMVDPN